MKIAGFFGFNNSIYLKGECLNKTIKINIGEREGKLMIPCLPKDFNKNKSKKALIQPNSEIEFISEFEWGEIGSWPNGDSYVCNFLLELDIKNDIKIEDIKENLIVSTQAWIDRFKENFFAFDYFIEEKMFKPTSKIKSGFRYHYRDKYQKTQNIYLIPKFSGSLKLKEPLAFNILEDIASVTSKNKSLREEYKLLKSAKIALQNKDFRMSLFESSSALEMCLSNLLSDKLEVNNKDLKQKILEGYNSIDKKIGLLKVLDVNLDKKLQEHLIKVRNRAIHAGNEVTENQAEYALKLCKKTLDEHLKDRFN